jgi:hypothetical protein
MTEAMWKAAKLKQHAAVQAVQLARNCLAPSGKGVDKNSLRQRVDEVRARRKQSEGGAYYELEAAAKRKNETCGGSKHAKKPLVKEQLHYVSQVGVPTIIIAGAAVSHRININDADVDCSVGADAGSDRAVMRDQARMKGQRQRDVVLTIPTSQVLVPAHFGTMDAPAQHKAAGSFEALVGGHHAHSDLADAGTIMAAVTQSDGHSLDADRKAGDERIAVSVEQYTGAGPSGSQLRPSLVVSAPVQSLAKRLRVGGSISIAGAEITAIEVVLHRPALGIGYAFGMSMAVTGEKVVNNIIPGGFSDGILEHNDIILCANNVDVSEMSLEATAMLISHNTTLQLGVARRIRTARASRQSNAIATLACGHKLMVTEVVQTAPQLSSATATGAEATATPTAATATSVPIAIGLHLGESAASYTPGIENVGSVRATAIATLAPRVNAIIALQQAARKWSSMSWVVAAEKVIHEKVAAEESAAEKTATEHKVAAAEAVKAAATAEATARAATADMHRSQTAKARATATANATAADKAQVNTTFFSAILNGSAGDLGFNLIGCSAGGVYIHRVDPDGICRGRCGHPKIVRGLKIVEVDTRDISHMGLSEVYALLKGIAWKTRLRGSLASLASPIEIGFVNDPAAFNACVESAALRAFAPLTKTEQRLAETKLGQIHLNGGGVTKASYGAPAAEPSGVAPALGSNATNSAPPTKRWLGKVAAVVESLGATVEPTAGSGQPLPGSRFTAVISAPSGQLGLRLEGSLADRSPTGVYVERIDPSGGCSAEPRIVRGLKIVQIDQHDTSNLTAAEVRTLLTSTMWMTRLRGGHVQPIELGFEYDPVGFATHTQRKVLTTITSSQVRAEQVRRTAAITIQSNFRGFLLRKTVKQEEEEEEEAVFKL